MENSYGSPAAGGQHCEPSLALGQVVTTCSSRVSYGRHLACDARRTAASGQVCTPPYAAGQWVTEYSDLHFGIPSAAGGQECVPPPTLGDIGVAVCSSSMHCYDNGYEIRNLQAIAGEEHSADGGQKCIPQSASGVYIASYSVVKSKHSAFGSQEETLSSALGHLVAVCSSRMHSIAGGHLPPLTSGPWHGTCFATDGQKRTPSPCARRARYVGSKK